MANNQNGKRVALLVTDGFEQAELLEPLKALKQAGVETAVISPSEGPAKTQSKGEAKGWDEKDWGETVKVDLDLESAKAADFDMLVLPGGVMNPDKLRTCKNAVAFVSDFFKQNKPVAAICHGPWTLIEAGAVSGKKMTSWPSLQTDLKNAGATWVDETVVVDSNLITSRNPKDLPAFNKAIAEALGSTNASNKAA